MNPMIALLYSRWLLSTEYKHYGDPSTSSGDNLNSRLAALPASTRGRSGCFQHAGEAAVGDEPQQRDEDLHGVGEPRTDERQRDGEGVEHGGKLAFEIAAERCGEFGFLAVLADDGGLQNVVRDGRQQQHAVVERGRHE